MSRFSSRVQLHGGVCNVITKNIGLGRTQTSIRIMYRNSTEEGLKFINIYCNGMVNDQVLAMNLQKHDSINIDGELSSTERIIDGQKLNLYSVNAQSISLVKRKECPSPQSSPAY